MKGFIGFGKFFMALSFFGLFFGLLSGLSYDILLIIAEPANPQTWSKLGMDFAKIIANSQGEISSAVAEFEDVNDPIYANFLIARIAGASLISFFMIWIIYKFLRKFTPSPSTSTLILEVLIAIGLVWFIGIVASFIVGKINWIPFSGWIDLIRGRELIINYILEQYQTKP